MHYLVHVTGNDALRYDLLACSCTSSGLSYFLTDTHIVAHLVFLIGGIQALCVYCQALTQHFPKKGAIHVTTETRTSRFDDGKYALFALRAHRAHLPPSNLYSFL